MKGIIDRFEGKFALVELEDGGFIEIEIAKLPKEACEGDAIIIEEEITLDEEETKKRREEIKKIVRNFWGK